MSEMEQALGNREYREKTWVEYYQGRIMFIGCLIFRHVLSFEMLLHSVDSDGDVESWMVVCNTYFKNQISI